MTDTNTAEREAIIRAAVAAMPHTNPLVADDLLGGFTMHTEADDIVAIFQAGRASLAASAGIACQCCGGSGEVFEHSEDCDDDLCALNGDEHSCTGVVRHCSCKASPIAVGATQTHIAAMERAWLWMENQADAQSKGGHATFDLLMLREERDALRAAIDAAASAGSEPVAAGSIDHLKLMMEESAWGGQILLSDALANIADFAASHPSPLEGMAGWISVDERLPQPFTTVLIHPRPTGYCCEGEVNTQRQWSYGEYETGFGHHQIKCKVTHWQPLPAPPLPASEAKEL